MSQHPEGDSAAPMALGHTGKAPVGAAVPDPTPTPHKLAGATRSWVMRRWLLVGGLTVVLAVPVGIGFAAAAGGFSSGPRAGTAPAAQPTGTASCPATCGTGGAGGMTQHMMQPPHDPADMAEHWKNMMGGGAMMGTEGPGSSSP